MSTRSVTKSASSVTGAVYTEGTTTYTDRVCSNSNTDVVASFDVPANTTGTISFYCYIVNKEYRTTVTINGVSHSCYTKETQTESIKLNNKIATFHTGSSNGLCVWNEKATSQSRIPNFTYEETYPDITKFTVENKNIEAGISCSVEIADGDKFSIQAIQNDKILATKKINGTSGTVIFEASNFSSIGATTFKVVAENSTFNATTEETKDVTLTAPQAKATLIDIPGATINTDEKFTIAWVSENQTMFELSVDGKTYKGTSEKSIVMPAHTVSKGSKTILLTITYSNSYYSNSSTISTSFTAFGKPITPQITNKSIISTATPSITWKSDDQVAYYVTIKKLIETIDSSGEVISQTKYYQTTKTLENNTTYNVSVKVKNQYGLWSDNAEIELSTQFTVPNTPTISAISDTTNGAIILNVNTDNENDTEYKNTEIWKREQLGEWKRMAYNLSNDDAWADFYVGNDVEYEYKARNIGNTGGISESDVITATTKVKGYTLYDVENLESKLSMKHDVTITPKLVTNVVTNLFAGADAPQASTDNTMYWQLSISFKTRDRSDINNIIKLMKTSNVLLLKDSRGHKFFGNIVGSPSFPETDLHIISIQLEFTETSFLEQDVYRGDNTGMKLIKWDGTWRFDGTQTYHS